MRQQTKKGKLIEAQNNIGTKRYEKIQRTRNNTPSNIKKVDEQDFLIAAQGDRTRDKKRDLLFDLYIRSGLTRQQAARRIEMVPGRHNLGGPARRPVARPLAIETELHKRSTVASTRLTNISVPDEDQNRRYGQIEIKKSTIDFENACELLTGILVLFQDAI